MDDLILPLSIATCLILGGVLGGILVPALAILLDGRHKDEWQTYAWEAGTEAASHLCVLLLFGMLWGAYGGLAFVADYPELAAHVTLVTLAGAFGWVIYKLGLSGILAAIKFLTNLRTRNARGAPVDAVLHR